jgi:hypothetical protein
LYPNVYFLVLKKTQKQKSYKHFSDCKIKLQNNVTLPKTAILEITNTKWALFSTRLKIISFVSGFYTQTI